MANSLINSNTTFTQAEKNFFIADAMFGLDTLNAGLLYMASDVKNDQYTFPKVVSTITLQAFNSIPTSSGSTTLSNKDVTLGKFMGYVEFEPAVFENHWQVDQISSNLLSRGLPATFENYLATNYTEQVLQPVEQMIWMGSTTYSGVTKQNIKWFDGLVKQAIVQTALNVPTSAITSANIVNVLELLKNKLPKALLSNANRYKNLKYVMSVEDAQKYEDALTTTTFKNNDTTQAGLNRYKGYSIVPVAGLEPNTIFFGHFDGTVNSNIHMALTSEANMSFTLDRLQNNSTLYFYKMINKMGVGIAKPYELAYITDKVIGDFNA